MNVLKVECTDLYGPPYPTLTPIEFIDIGATIAPLPSLPQFGAAGQGEPQAFYIRGTDGSSNTVVIGFDPIPSRNGAVNNINVWYDALPTLITTIDNNTVPDLPIDLHALIPRRMCFLAASAEGSPKAQMYLQMYNASLAKMLSRYVRGRQGTREVIRVVD